jgi:hypothetical protein
LRAVGGFVFEARRWYVQVVGVERVGGTRLFVVALLLVGLVVGIAGCAFDSGLGIGYGRGSVVVVRESFAEQDGSDRVQGVAARSGQVARIDCAVTVFYTVREATGTAFLSQLALVHLRTEPLRKGTAYRLECDDRLIVELPSSVAGVRASAISKSNGRQTSLPVVRVSSVALAGGRRLRPEVGTKLVVVRSSGLRAGDYRVQFEVGSPQTTVVKMKALYAASVSCGRSRYLQPILPIVSSMTQAPAFTLQATTGVQIPRVAGAVGTESQATRVLSCWP